MKLSTSLFALLSALPVIIAYEPPKLKVALTVSMITDWDHGDVAWLDGNDPNPKAFKITSPPPPRETTYIGDLHYTQLGVGYPILITREKGIYTMCHVSVMKEPDEGVVNVDVKLHGNDEVESINEAVEVDCVPVEGQ